MRPPLRDHLFVVSYPEGDGHRWSVRGIKTHPFGPYDAEDTAVADRWALLQRWKARANLRGGYVCCLTRERWVVVLPVSVPCPGMPLHGAVGGGGVRRS